MFWLILTITLLLSVALIVMVLLQPSKGGGITAAFGGIGGSLGSTFGARRTLEALGKGTTWTAVAIAALCLLANLFFVPSIERTNTPVTQGAQMPATPAPAQDLLQRQQPSTPATGGGNQSRGAGAEVQPGNAQQQPQQPTRSTPTEEDN